MTARERSTARPGRSRRRLAGCLAVIGVLAAVGCTDDGAGSTTTTEPSTTSAETATTVAAPVCEPEGAAPVTATPVPGSTTDLDVVSFDGTVIRAHWFPLEGATAAAPAPTVLMGPGWSLPGDTDVEATGILGAIDIATLWDAGFNVLTWDPRGFGASGGVAQVDAAEFEGRDVQVLLDWVAAQPVATLDAEHDPAVGMVGGSYGGGIQLVVAADDCRVDAIVPIVAWHSLRTSLFKADTVKTGWATKLTEASSRGRVDPHVGSAYTSGVETGRLSDADVEWFESRGPAEAVARITAPTLIVQGTVDTLFTLDEGVTNLTVLRDAGVPVAMVWYCDGHGVCLTEAGAEDRVSSAAVAWLQRYVAGDDDAPDVPGFDVVDQHGVRYVADEFPTGDGEPITATGSGVLELVAEGGSGPVVLGEDVQGILSNLVQSITPAPADHAIDVPIEVDGGPHLVVGAPELTFTYTGTAGSGDRPQRVFAQLVDGDAGLVIGNQITPIQVELDGEQHTVTVPLEMVAFSAEPGAALRLQLVATTVAYAEPQLGGQLDVESIELTLPVTEAMERTD